MRAGRGESREASLLKTTNRTKPNCTIQRSRCRRSRREQRRLVRETELLRAADFLRLELDELAVAPLHGLHQHQQLARVEPVQVAHESPVALPEHRHPRRPCRAARLHDGARALGCGDAATRARAFHVLVGARALNCDCAANLGSGAVL